MNDMRLLVAYTAATNDPEGGIIRRRPGSREPNGVLETIKEGKSVWKCTPCVVCPSCT